MFIKDKTKVTSRVNSERWDGVEFSRLLFYEKKFSFRSIKS